MSPIWPAIIFGVLVVPIISSFTKDIEEKIDEAEKNGEKINILYGKIKTKEDAKTLSKLLTIGIFIIFAVTIIILILFSGPSIKN